jgi:hypothetical protein
MRKLLTTRAAVVGLALATCGLAVLALATFGGAGHAAAAAAPAINCAASESSKDQFPPVPNTIDGTCAVIPLDMNGTPLQGNADLYAWLTFLAVNWPVNAATCSANAQANILTAPPNPTWLSFLSNEAVFVAAGSPPKWCYAPSKAPAAAAGAYFASADAALSAQRAGKLALLPPKVRALAEQHPEVRMFLHNNAKAQDLISTAKLSAANVSPGFKGILEATGDPLTDQNGRFVRYTINLGQDEYNYILQKSLWKKSGQLATGDLSFPFSGMSSPKELGAMEFKAAWKVLGANDVPSHFFTTLAIVYNDESGSPSPGRNPVTVGLVGLHVTHKTKKQHKWLWATFEQVENETRSFYNPSCPASQCPPNVETAKGPPYVELDPKTGRPLNKPVQVVSVPASQPTSPQLNTQFQVLLRNTPWAYYRLISTQWVGNLGTAPKPALLGNPVLETFVAKTKPYSCLNCHQDFAHDHPGGFKSDFSFAINAKQ